MEATPRSPRQRTMVRWLPFPVWYPLTKPPQDRGNFLRRLSQGIRVPVTSGSTQGSRYAFREVQGLFLLPGRGRPLSSESDQKVDTKRQVWVSLFLLSRSIFVFSWIAGPKFPRCVGGLNPLTVSLLSPKGCPAPDLEPLISSRPCLT